MLQSAQSERTIVKNLEKRPIFAVMVEENPLHLCSSLNGRHRQQTEL